MDKTKTTKEVKNMLKEHLKLGIRTVELGPGLSTNYLGLYWDDDLINELATPIVVS